jgi:alpha-tubulin suppressor-like RCC1 family protein
MLCIKTDGTLWAWGNSTVTDNKNPVGTGGVYAQPNARDRSSPVQVGSDTWSEIWTASYASIGIKTAGSLWGTGNGRAVTNSEFYNQNGKVFGRIGTDSDWAKAVTASWGVSTMVKTNGTLWTMGNGLKGQLGHGNTQYYVSPKQVGALTNWAQPVFFGMARSSEVYANGCIKTDGTLWTWGGNGAGQLGHGDTTDRSSPVQVGLDTNWRFVAMAGYANSNQGFCIGVKTNGKLYGWGQNDHGQLGLGDTVNRSSPVLIGNSENWVRPAAGMRMSFCTTT